MNATNLQNFPPYWERVKNLIASARDWAEMHPYYRWAQDGAQAPRKPWTVQGHAQWLSEKESREAAKAVLAFADARLSTFATA